MNSNPAYGLEINKSLLDIVNDYHLEQLVHENTCENHILDLLFCIHPTKISKIAVVLSISDHKAIYFHFNLKSLSYKSTGCSVVVDSPDSIGTNTEVKTHEWCLSLNRIVQFPWQ